MFRVQGGRVGKLVAGDWQGRAELGCVLVAEHSTGRREIPGPVDAGAVDAAVRVWAPRGAKVLVQATTGAVLYVAHSPDGRTGWTAEGLYALERVERQGRVREQAAAATRT